MKISFDLDGVLLEKPEIYKALCRTMKNGGAQIGVLTGHKHSSKDKVLRRLYSLGYPKFDFYFGRREEDMAFNGAIRKSQVIDQECIDAHFDDYDFDWPDTVDLFASGGQESKILRLRSTESGKLGAVKV